MEPWGGLRRDLYNIWLFTRSDLKTIVVPQTIFGVLGGLPQSRLTQGDRTAGEVLWRAPLVTFWVWIILCPFNIDNQRSPASIEEDKINRPWRPLPAKRLTPEHAWWLQMIFHILALLYSFGVGGIYQWVCGIILGWLYNVVGLADCSCIGKNAVNALGYATFASKCSCSPQWISWERELCLAMEFMWADCLEVGAVSVATRGSDFTVQGLQWFAFMGAVIFTTVQMQDLEDVVGDAARGRRTVPLVIGDRQCRWSIAILVPLWSVGACCFWGVLNSFSVISAALGLLVTYRVLYKKGLLHDKVTFRMWNVWIISLYVLPLASWTY